MPIKHNGQLLVSPKIAREVKELSFNKPTFTNFTDENTIAPYDTIDYIAEEYGEGSLEDYLFVPCVNNYVEAPTTAQVIDWFRETFKFHLSIDTDPFGTQWVSRIVLLPRPSTNFVRIFDISTPYEKVLEKGIEVLIETLKSFKNNEYPNL